MKTFQDNAGRIWTIAVNVAAIKRARALIGVDVYKLIDDRMTGLGELLSDPVTFVDLLYVLCKDEADKLGVSDEDFGRGMAGDALDAATSAFVSELIDFFPNPRLRAGLRKVIEKGRQVNDGLVEMLEARIDRIDPRTEAAKLFASSGGSPESSESTPDPSPSANSN